MKHILSLLIAVAASLPLLASAQAQPSKRMQAPAPTQLQEKGVEPPNAFIIRSAGNFADIFAPGYAMQPDQRFEARYIFDVARAYCLSLKTGTKLVSHEPAIFVVKDQKILGTAFKYRCGR